MNFFLPGAETKLGQNLHDGPSGELVEEDSLYSLILGGLKIGWGGKAFRWGVKARCNAWGG